jgi:hypothetical protein
MNYITHEGGGGNHGHKLKNIISAYIMSQVYNLTYLHTPELITDCFGVGFGEGFVPWTDSKKHKLKPPYDALLKIVYIGHFPHISSNHNANWYGDVNIIDLQNILNNNQTSDTLFVLRNYVYFPHTFSDALKLNLVPTTCDECVLENTIKKLSLKYSQANIRNVAYNTENEINIAIQINRGQDFDKPTYHKSPHSMRYIFPLDYFNNIINQLLNTLKQTNKQVKFKIYTEQYNSEPIVKYFADRKNITVHIGSNRGSRTITDLQYCEDIFYHLVNCDILVTCNSSFSVASTFFRYKKPFLYFPHLSFERLPFDWAIETDTSGGFDAKKILKYIN